jgi:Tol biopolymer transport system component
MTYANDMLERTVREWLLAEAEVPMRDHLEDVLSQTSVQRQRPAWSSPERWLPMDTALRPRLFRTPRPSQVLLVGALILALLAALLLYVGSRQHRLPPPFGPARNGIVLSSGNGDIVQIDPATLARRTVIGGPTFDFGPAFSRDGTRFLFLRGAPNDCGKPDCGLYLMAANADGSHVRQLTPNGMPQLDWADWSPDGAKIAFLTADPKGPGRVLAVVNADGSGLHVDTAGRPLYPAGWLPPDGAEIVIRSEHASAVDPPVGIYAVHLDGTGLRSLTTRPAHSSNDYQTVAVSQDGRLVAYRDDGDQGGFQEHILDLATGVDRILPGPKGQSGGTFSPDGTQIAYLRGVSGDPRLPPTAQADMIQLVVAPVDGSSTGRLLGKRAPWGSDGPTINNYSWTADGTAILANYDAEQIARLLPIDGSAYIDLDQGSLALPSMQRLAP